MVGSGVVVLCWSSLAEKVASVLGYVVIVSMEDYRTGTGADDGSDVEAIDFDALARNLQVRVRPLSNPFDLWVGLDACRLPTLMTGRNVERNGGFECAVLLHNLVAVHYWLLLKENRIDGWVHTGKVELLSEREVSNFLYQCHFPL